MPKSLVYVIARVLIGLALFGTISPAVAEYEQGKPYLGESALLAMEPMATAKARPRDRTSATPALTPSPPPFKAPRPGLIIPRSLTSGAPQDRIAQLLGILRVTARWTFHIAHQETIHRRLLLEGQVSPPYERNYYDPLVFYLVIGPDFLSLEVSRDFDGERLLEYLFGLLGAPLEPPRTQVGGRQDEEEGALLLVEWLFPPEGRPDLLRRLGDILGAPLPSQT
jgi:hypothetical protein